MEQSFRMKQSQRLAMTAQMQQAIRLLQMPLQELRAVMEKEYMENPVLELAEPESGADALSEERSLSWTNDAGESDGERGEPEHGGAGGVEFASSSVPTLEEELLEQAAFAFSAERQRELAVFIIGSIDARGYLVASVEEISRETGADAHEIMGVLRRIQEFDPPGVGARDLRECLRIQARQRGIYEGLVAALIDRHLAEVARAEVRQIAAEEDAHPGDVQLAVDILRTLNPKPGGSYGPSDAGYIVPDVLVRKEKGGYAVSLCDKELPKLRISGLYRDVAGLDEKTRRYIGKRLEAAKWLLKSIGQRRRTVCRVAEEMVRRQLPCVEGGMAHLRPMSMKQVAEAIGMHESTVSRAVAGKYVQLPWGVVPLRAFFATSLGDADEAFLSGQAKAAMEALIKGEDARSPLSDQKLTELLKERGMQLSRRTVMKYREQLGYPSSVKRKRY